MKISTALKYATSVGRRMITINQFENWREIIFAAAISCQLQHQREATSSFAEVYMPTFNVGLFVIQSKDFLTLRSFCYWQMLSAQLGTWYPTQIQILSWWLLIYSQGKQWRVSTDQFSMSKFIITEIIQVLEGFILQLNGFPADV